MCKVFFCKGSPMRSMARVDFPEPETPQKPTKHPNGIFALNFFKLCKEASLIIINSFSGLRRGGLGNFFLPLSQRPVKQAGSSIIS